MFYCETCRAKNDWPDSAMCSRGTCEMCGEHHRYCYDVPSRDLPKPTPTPESPQMPSKATDTELATQALPDPLGPQEALLQAIQSGAVAQWASGGRVLARKRGSGTPFKPIKGTPDFTNENFEWQMAPAIEYPATPEALLLLMQSVLMEADHDTERFVDGTDRDETCVGLDSLAAKLGLEKQWKLLADKCYE